MLPLFKLLNYSAALPSPRRSLLDPKTTCPSLLPSRPSWCLRRNSSIQKKKNYTSVVICCPQPLLFGIFKGNICTWRKYPTSLWLCENIFLTKQGSKPFHEHYSFIKSKWEELSLYQPYPTGLAMWKKQRGENSRWYPTSLPLVLNMNQPKNRSWLVWSCHPKCYILQTVQNIYSWWASS